MSCSGPYADANDFGNYFCIAVHEDDEPVVNRTLRLAASRIHAARQASDQCGCDLSEWAADHLMELNIWVAAAVYNCPCSSLKLTDEQKQFIMEQAREDLTLIRTGQVELCSGETGTEYPAVAWAERSLTVYSTREIIRNRFLREGS
jgi:hypothetical protein